MKYYSSISFQLKALFSAAKAYLNRVTIVTRMRLFYVTRFFTQPMNVDILADGKKKKKSQRCSKENGLHHFVVHALPKSFYF